MSNNTKFLLQQVSALTFNQSVSTNRTNVSATKSGSKVTASLTIIFAVVTLILNGLILASFIKRPNLRTAFNCYVINLAVIDVISATVSMPMNIVKEFYGQWPLNGLICTIILSINQMCNSGNRAAHLLIAANRLWAVTFPLSYRNRHTKQLAVKVVLLAWSLTTCLVVPRVIIVRRNINYSLSAIDPSCAIETDSYPAFHMAFNVIVFNVPEIIILLAYPLLVFKLRQKMPNKVSIFPAKSSRPETLDSDTSGAFSSKAHTRRMTLKVTDEEDVEDPVKAVNSRNKNFQPASFSHQQHVVGQGDPEVAVDIPQPYKLSSRSKGHNRLFAYLVLSVIFCWTPNHVFFLWSAITGRWNVPFFTVQFFLAYVNSWLNPIMIYLASLQIRKAVNEMIVRC